MDPSTPTLFRRCLAEWLGTFVLVFFGCGAVHVAVLTGALSGLWQVAIVWGVAIMLAAYTIGGLSGAHINPAITLAFAVWGRFPWRDAPAYVASQLAGAFLAAAVLFLLFNPFLAAKEAQVSVVRGQPGSELTAMCYGEYFPNPAGQYTPEQRRQLDALISEPVAMLAEVIGTMILAFVVFAVTDERNRGAPLPSLAPVFIGLTVAVLIVVIAPLTQACFNPARDFGPRLFAFLAGWGTVAIPGPRPSGFATVYILSPIAGAILGGWLYVRVFREGNPVQPSKS
jgi:glycerol uptake facilitator protein